ncbi:MAG: thiol reductant ABC exporter subunit CydD [Alcanivorax sp.]|nr:thiol reductant ABC exporter subunit CydD [Alcanivorax sp.]
MPTDTDQSFHDQAPDPAAWLAAQRHQVRVGWRSLYLAALTDAPLAITQAALLAWLAAGIIHAGSLAWMPAILLLLTLAARSAAAAWRARQAAGIGAELTRAVRETVAEALLRGRGAALTTGDASTALLEQAEAVGRYHAGFAVQRRIASIATLLFLIAAFAVDWVVASIFLITAPLIPVFMVLVGGGAQRASDRQLDSLRFLGGYFLDRVRGALTLRAFNREDAEIAAVDGATDTFRKRTMGVLRIAFLTSAVLELFAALSVALVALYVGLHLLNLVAFGPGPTLTFATGLFLLLLAPEFYQPLRQMAAGYHDRAAARSAAEVLAPLCTGVSPLNQVPVPPTNAATDVTLEDIGYRPPDADAFLFRHCSLSVPAGGCLAIRGDSGTGKSTLLRMVAGLLSASEGRVRHTGAPAPPLALDPGRLAWAGQHPWFVQGTVADNLRQASADASETAMKEVLARCGLDTLPQGLATPLDEYGGGLSGGQGRRLGVARALISGAPLILLDEPTAEQDADSEARLLTALREIKGEHTLIIATHSERCAALADMSLWLGEDADRTATETHHAD